MNAEIDVDVLKQRSRLSKAAKTDYVDKCFVDREILSPFISEEMNCVEKLKDNNEDALKRVTFRLHGLSTGINLFRKSLSTRSGKDGIIEHKTPEMMEMILKSLDILSTAVTDLCVIESKRKFGDDWVFTFTDPDDTDNIVMLTKDSPAINIKE